MKIFLFFLIIFTFSCCISKKPVRERVVFEKFKEKEIRLQNASNYIGSKSYKLAEKEVKRAIEIDPKDPKPYLILGSIYDKMNEDKKAIEAYITGIRLKGRKKDEKSGTSSLRNPFQPMSKREN